MHDKKNKTGHAHTPRTQRHATPRHATPRHACHTRHASHATFRRPSHGVSHHLVRDGADEFFRGRNCRTYMRQTSSRLGSGSNGDLPRGAWPPTGRRSQLVAWVRPSCGWLHWAKEVGQRSLEIRDALQSTALRHATPRPPRHAQAHHKSMHTQTTHIAQHTTHTVFHHQYSQ